MERGPSSAIPHVSCAPSKIPYSGFSPVRLQAVASRDHLYPACAVLGVKHQVCIPPAVLSLIGASSFLWTLLPLRVGFSAHPASGLRHDHHSPRVLGSERVVLSHSSSLLRPDPPVSPTPAAFPGSLVIPRVFARRPGLGCQRDLPCFGSVLLPYVPSPLRREEERGTPVSPRSPWPSSTEHGVGSSIFPDTSFGRGLC